MPTTIAPSTPHGTIGPGLPAVVTVDSALPAGVYTLSFTVSVAPFPSLPFWQEDSPLSVTPGETVEFILGTNANSNLLKDDNGRAANSDDSVTLQVAVKQGFVQQDSANVTATWDATQGLGKLIALGSTTGFTATDRGQVDTTSANVSNLIGMMTATVQTAAGVVQKTFADLFSGVTLDALLIHEFTAGPTPDPVTVDPLGPWFGVIIRVTTISDHYAAVTPSHLYYIPDLAVAEFYRGVDLLERKGIHTPSLIIQDVPGLTWALLGGILLQPLPPELKLVVTPALGNEVQVFGMQTP